MEFNDLIIKAALKGNKDAFRNIVEAYQTIVFAICLNILKDYQEAENAAQETSLVKLKFDNMNFKFMNLFKTKL
jgi:DNA-directed RNA polymerase specialized sigma24 family protein